VNVGDGASACGIAFTGFVLAYYHARGHGGIFAPGRADRAPILYSHGGKCRHGALSGLPLAPSALPMSLQPGLNDAAGR
jgi:hypothetical protein